MIAIGVGVATSWDPTRKTALRFRSEELVDGAVYGVLNAESHAGQARNGIDGIALERGFHAEGLAPDGDVKRGRPPRLAFSDQVLAAVLHLRVALAAAPLAVLFGSSRSAMHRTLLKIRRLLRAHSIVIPPAATPPSQPSRLGFEP